MITMQKQNATVVCGMDHSVVLLTNGTVRCWGDNTIDQCDSVHLTFTDVIKIACGQDHSVALLSNGTVRCWGYNDASCFVLPTSIRIIY